MRGVVAVSSTLMKKSWRDLSIRKGRTVFTILSIMIGIGSMGLFAVVPLMNEAVDDEIREENLFNLRIVIEIDLNETQIGELEAIDNVRAVEGRVGFFTRIYVGERRNDAIFVGVEDFEDQHVDIVKRNSGSFPGHMEVLTDSGNGRQGVYEGRVGDSVRAITALGLDLNLTITGKGQSLIYTEDIIEGTAIFYTTKETAQEMANVSGYNIISFDLERTDKDAIDGTVEAIRDYLNDPEQVKEPVVAFEELQEVRREGDWEGKEFFTNMMSVVYIMAFLTIFCSIFLMSNTMHTIVAEQRQNIASMKAIGARRADILRSFLFTSVIMGSIGALAGALLGICFTLMIVDLLVEDFGITPGAVVHHPTILMSALTGILISMLASLPAIHGSMKITVREALESHGISRGHGRTCLNRFLMHASGLPRDIQLGIRNIGRNEARSIMTILQVAVAVGVFLGVMALGHSITQATSKEIDNWGIDIRVDGAGGKGSLTVNESTYLQGFDDVAWVEPFQRDEMIFRDNTLFAYGFHHNTKAYRYERTMVEGRWFTEKDEASKARVVVITKVLQKAEGIEVGDMLSIMTATGSYDFRVIGINSGTYEWGMITFFPYETLRNVLLQEDRISGFFIRSTSASHGDIDKLSTMIEDGLMDRGYTVENDIWYVHEEEDQRANHTLSNILAIIGSLIVLITLIGLMNTMVMNILDRTKEIGILRCIGARARDIRYVLASEGVVMSCIGWVIGIPVGYVMGRLIWWRVMDMLHMDYEFLFPLTNLGLVLVITLGITLAIMQLPLRRAVDLKPGDALRYE